jgi:hypothetical protein
MPLYDLRTQVRKLISEDDVSAFPFERELLLFQYQTWIYFPKPKRAVDTALVLAATRFLENLEHDLLGASRHSAATLSRCLKDKKYSGLYDAVFGRSGGWTCLIRTMSPSAFHDRLEERRGDAETVCAIIDYRFRFLEHGGTDRKQANISHGQFFRWKNRAKPLTGRTIGTRWRDNRPSAPQLYVSETVESFFPPDIRQEDFVETMRKRAADVEGIRRFFGYCAYIVDRLKDPKDRRELMVDLRKLKRPPPKSDPLSPEELKRMENYKTEYLTMHAH